MRKQGIKDYLEIALKQHLLTMTEGQSFIICRADGTTMHFELKEVKDVDSIRGKYPTCIIVDEYIGEDNE
jgi:hypothetical protein